MEPMYRNGGSATCTNRVPEFQLEQYQYHDPHPHFHYEMGGLKAHIKWLAGVIL